MASDRVIIDTGAKKVGSDGVIMCPHCGSPILAQTIYTAAEMTTKGGRADE